MWKSRDKERGQRRAGGKQEQRNENRREKVRWEESLTVQNGQRKRRESAGGAGQ